MQLVCCYFKITWPNQENNGRFADIRETPLFLFTILLMELESPRKLRLLYFSYLFMKEVIYICKQNLCFLHMFQVICYLYCAAKCGHRKKSIYLPAYLEKKLLFLASVAHVCTSGAGRERGSSFSLS